MDKADRTQARLLALFLLGCLLLLPPLLLVFNHPHRLLGIPVLYLYVFLTWGVIIALGAGLAHGLVYDRTAHDADKDRGAAGNRRDA
jgi:hypothetical protein